MVLAAPTYIDSWPEPASRAEDWPPAPAPASAAAPIDTGAWGRPVPQRPAMATSAPRSRGYSPPPPGPKRRRPTPPTPAPRYPGFAPPPPPAPARRPRWRRMGTKPMEAVVAAIILGAVAGTHWAVPATDHSPAAWSQDARSLLGDIKTVQEYLGHGVVPDQVLATSRRDLNRARARGTPAAPTLETVWTQALAETSAALEETRSDPRVANERLLLATQELSVIIQALAVG